MEIKKIFVIKCVKDVEQKVEWFVCDVLDGNNCFATKEEAQKECERRNGK